jgi:hypothetical protein
MLGINLKTGVEATLVRLNAHSQGRHLRNLAFVWGHNTAAISENTRGVTVYFPAIDEAKAVPQGLLHRLVGYACHELGHHWFTNSKDWEAVAGNDQWLHSLINGLEDPRIEQAVIDSGFAGNSRNLFEGLVNHVVKGEVPTDFDNIPFILAVEGRRLNGYNILAPQTYQSTPWAKDLEWALTEAHKAQDTYTITRIALELAVRLNRYDDEGPEGNPGKDGGNPGEGKEGEGQPGDDTTEGQPGESGQPGDGEGQDGEGQGQDGQPGDGEGEGQGGQPGDDQGGEGQEQGKGHGGVHQGRVNNDPTSWINEEMADHQTKAQLDGKVGHIVQPTFHKFD